MSLILKGEADADNVPGRCSLKSRCRGCGHLFPRRLSGDGTLAGGCRPPARGGEAEALGEEKVVLEPPALLQSD